MDPEDDAKYQLFKDEGCNGQTPGVTNIMFNKEKTCIGYNIMSTYIREINDNKAPKSIKVYQGVFYFDTTIRPGEACYNFTNRERLIFEKSVLSVLGVTDENGQRMVWVRWPSRKNWTLLADRHHQLLAKVWDDCIIVLVISLCDTRTPTRNRLGFRVRVRVRVPFH